MDIEEVRKKKKELEEQTCGLITAFEKDTGSEVASISITTKTKSFHDVNGLHFYDARVINIKATI